LEDEGVLYKIFSYVGTADHIFAAGVCRKWRGRYLTVCYDDAKVHEGEKLLTSFKSAAITVERLKWALNSGLPVSAFSSSKSFARLIARSADPIGVLSALRQQGLRWSAYLCSAAAWLNKLELLQWLRAQGCIWQLKTLLNDAAKGGGVDLLKWLRQQAPDQFSAAKAHMLYYAGLAGNLTAASWLLQAGAPWPESYMRPIIARAAVAAGIPKTMCWPVSAVQWALSTGRTWGNWRCCDLARERYKSGRRRRSAKELFAWAHANGCPCTCEADAAAAAAAVASAVAPTAGVVAAPAAGVAVVPAAAAPTAASTFKAAMAAFSLASDVDETASATEAGLAAIDLVATIAAPGEAAVVAAAAVLAEPEGEQLVSAGKRS
jgi:hypothetical protein